LKIFPSYKLRTLLGPSFIVSREFYKILEKNTGVAKRYPSLNGRCGKGPFCDILKDLARKVWLAVPALNLLIFCVQY
jgi:hypothetical protein